MDGLYIGNTDDTDDMREKANLLCKDTLGVTHAQNGIYIGTFTKNAIVVFRNIEGRLDQYYKIISEDVKSIWFSNTGRFLSALTKKGNNNMFLVVD